MRRRPCPGSPAFLLGRSRDHEVVYCNFGDHLRACCDWAHHANRVGLAGAGRGDGCRDVRIMGRTGGQRGLGSMGSHAAAAMIELLLWFAPLVVSRAMRATKRGGIGQSPDE